MPASKTAGALGLGFASAAVRTLRSRLQRILAICFSPSPLKCETPRFGRHLLVWLLLLSLQFPVRAEMALHTSVNRVVEGSFTSAKERSDPFNETELDVVVSGAEGSSQKVPAFWAGGQTWRFRYSTSKAGLYHFRTECSDRNDGGLNGVSGSIEVRAGHSTNAFYEHGLVRVAADKTHFEHADGTPFLWLADTWWMGLCQRLSWPDDFKWLVADRVAKGFNVIQIVAGLYPDMGAFDERGANEGGFPWTRDYGRINPAYFDAADRRIEWLADSGLAPCIVGAWGYHIPWLGVDRMKKHWRNLVARYGAYPVFWCLAGEGAMPYYLSKHPAEDNRYQKQSLATLAAYVREIDPWHHPVSIHPTDMARRQLDDPSLIDFDMLQTGHGDRGSIPNTVATVRASRAATPTMPTIDAEVCYEGILGTCFADVERFMVWSCLLSGAAGHTYGANGIWQVNQPNHPYGNSPAGNTWGSTPWKEAAQLPGSKQTGLVRKVLEGYEWWRFEPHPEWAAFAAPGRAVTLGKWIWYPEGNPAVDAPVAPRYFRRTFVLPSLKGVLRAMLSIGADDRFEVFLNGKPVGSRVGWKPAQDYNVEQLLCSGTNVLAVVAENLKAPVAQNPAGLICGLEAVWRDGDGREIISDSSWRVSREEAAGWKEASFDDSGWAQAKEIGRAGDGPWGSLREDSAYDVPYAAGIPRQVRVVYIPKAEPVVIRQLEEGKTYSASLFNPQSGERALMGDVRPSRNGTWKLETYAPESTDWVLVLEARKTAQTGNSNSSK